MPNRDGTGPNGQGARTGRGMGDCKDNAQAQNIGRGYGRGRAKGMGANAGQGMGRIMGRLRGCGRGRMN